MNCIFSQHVFPDGSYTFTHFGTMRGASRAVFTPNDSPPMTVLGHRYATPPLPHPRDLKTLTGGWL